MKNDKLSVNPVELDDSDWCIEDITARLRFDNKWAKRLFFGDLFLWIAAIIFSFVNLWVVSYGVLYFTISLMCLAVGVGAIAIWWEVYKS